MKKFIIDLLHSLADALNRKTLPSSVGEYQEVNRLILKAARCCAYDLRHAAADNRDPVWRDRYHDRAEYWLGIFDAGDDGKNYRDRLHNTIMSLEIQVEKYDALIKHIKLNHPEALVGQEVPDSDIPF